MWSMFSQACSFLRRGRDAPRTRAGFSLTELLVSLLILGLISMAATSALSVGKRIWQKAQVVPDATLAEAERDLLRRVLALRVAGARNRGAGISGSKTDLNYKGLSRTEGGYYEVADMRLQLTDKGVEISSKRKGGKQTLVLKHLKPIGFKYQGQQTATVENTDWVEDWLPGDPAPELVRLEFAAPEGQAPQSLVVKLP